MIEIVKYEPKYRKPVRDCVYETGYGGESAECYFEDRELFADLLILYYTDCEPESAFVPLVDGEPAGYLLGCVDTVKCDEITKKEILPGILKDLMAGKYQTGPLLRRNLYRAILSEIRKENIPKPIKEYPAHLHIDLFKPYRRFGIGGRLIDTYLEYLKGLGIPGVHLGTSTAHTLALPFYEKLGFQRYSVRRLTKSYFKELTDRDFYNVVYVKKIR